MILLEAILFILSSGLLFNKRFRENPFLVLIAGTIGLVSSYFLTEEIYRRFIAPPPSSIVSDKPLRLPIDPDSRIPVLRKAGLNPEVEHAVMAAELAAERARRIVLQVLEKETTWDGAANRARTAAGDAKLELRGTKVLHPVIESEDNQRETGDYAGEVALVGGVLTPEGFGEMLGTSWGTYHGHWHNGKRDGPGVYSNRRGWQYKADYKLGYRPPGLVVLERPSRDPTDNTYIFVGDDGTGLGYKKTSYQDSRSYQIGHICDGGSSQTCYLIEVRGDGTIYAGQENKGGVGVGAVFSPEGSVVKQGVWKDGVLDAEYTP